MIPSGYWTSPQAYLTATDKDIDWSFLMNLPAGSKNEISKFDFLCGECEIFVLALHNVLGYEYREALDEELNLIHALCIIGEGEGTLFADI